MILYAFFFLWSVAACVLTVRHILCNACMHASMHACSMYTVVAPRRDNFISCNATMPALPRVPCMQSLISRFILKCLYWRCDYAFPKRRQIDGRLRAPTCRVIYVDVPCGRIYNACLQTLHYNEAYNWMPIYACLQTLHYNEAYNWMPILCMFANCIKQTHAPAIERSAVAM